MVRDKYDLIKEDAEWVINHYGSEAEETINPGSRAKAQARRIAIFVRQYDEALEALDGAGIDLLGLERR